MISIPSKFPFVLQLGRGCCLALRRFELAREASFEGRLHPLSLPDIMEVLSKILYAMENLTLLH